MDVDVFGCRCVFDCVRTVCVCLCVCVCRSWRPPRRTRGQPARAWATGTQVGGSLIRAWAYGTAWVGTKHTRGSWRAGASARELGGRSTCARLHIARLLSRNAADRDNSKQPRECMDVCLRTSCSHGLHLFENETVTKLWTLGSSWLKRMTLTSLRASTSALVCRLRKGVRYTLYGVACVPTYDTRATPRL